MKTITVRYCVTQKGLDIEIKTLDWTFNNFNNSLSPVVLTGLFDNSLSPVVLTDLFDNSLSPVVLSDFLDNSLSPVVLTDLLDNSLSPVVLTDLFDSWEQTNSLKDSGGDSREVGEAVIT